MTKTASPARPTVTAGELWTAKQRQMHSLHYAISYRASFKPELPDFCIRKYSCPGDVVVDPFCGRGTTALQANLLGRSAWVNDANPLAVSITQAKTRPVLLREIEKFLNEIHWQKNVKINPSSSLLAFYHRETLRELYLLKEAIIQDNSDVSRFVQLLALSRLHGHSAGFFSAYSMPQLSVLPTAQRRINAKRGEEPTYRPIVPRILAKGRRALQDDGVEAIRIQSEHNRYRIGDARDLRGWADHSADLIVTSPPFLNCVNYLDDNWLEHWFLDIDACQLKGKIIQTASLNVWMDFVAAVLKEMARILRLGGVCVLEVGDVCSRGVKINLDETVAQITKEQSELQLVEVFIHKQEFTKLANCFSVSNNRKGTNTQRLLVFEKNKRLSQK